MILIIQIYIYLEEDTNTCENLKQSIPWKKLKIDRHMYIIIYTNLELKTKYLYKNKWKQKSARLRGSRSSFYFKIEFFFIVEKWFHSMYFFKIWIYKYRVKIAISILNEKYKWDGVVLL